MHTDRTSELDALRAEVAARLPAPPDGTSHDGLEERCRAYLRRLRWPAGVECPRRRALV